MAVGRTFCLLVAVLMTFSNNSLGITFKFDGFKSKSELFIVTESNWVYNFVNESCYSLTYPPDNSVGRLLHPQAVSMRKPGSTAVMSFSTTFIFQIYHNPLYIGIGSGFKFLMVPNNSTVGAPYDFLGLITTTTDTVTKDVASDEHTFGVEFDTYQNPRFNDENDNHIGLDFASMNSTFSFKPTIPLITTKKTVYHQVWIDYDQAQSTMDIYLAVYQAWVVKPAVPSVSWLGVDLSLLSEPKFIGFSAAIGAEASDRHSIFAWSFSNEGEAPPISLAKDAPPSGPSPPPPPGTRKPSPPPPRTPGVPGAEPPGKPSEPNLGLIISVTVASAIVAAAILWLCWIKIFARPLRIFLSNTGGGPKMDGTGKNFASRLHENLERKRWSSRKYRVKVFFDKESVKEGDPIARVILKELGRFDVGVVVVTREYFMSPWCMTELIAFKDAWDSGRRVIVWPLFYELKPKQVRQLLTERGDRAWETRWVELSQRPSHPLDLDKARAAVAWLTSLKGLKYPAETERGHDKDYIEVILKEMETILQGTRSWKADWDRIRPRPAPPEQPDVPLASVA